MLFPKMMAVALQCAFAWSLAAASYFVAEGGDDLAAGTSEASAWRSLERLARVNLELGDTVWLKGELTGPLIVDEEDSGVSGKPVVIRSAGEAKAVIRAGDGDAVWVRNAAHLTIRDLKVVGNGPTVNRGFGILCENTSTNGRKDGLTIENVEVSGFGKHGIMVTGAPHGFSTVRIRNCAMFNNLKGGMEVAGRLPWDAKHYAHADVVVSDCAAYENTGDPNFTQNHSGSGIVLYQVDGGKIDRCKAWGNGALCPAKGGGPVGIWTCASRRVVIEYCESFGNLSKGLDGGGFDLDGGSEECVLQYNYSRDNRGPGLMAYTYEYASHQDRDNVIRFNISMNDALNSEKYAGLWIRADGRPIRGLKVYNNTIITSAAPAAWIHGAGVEVELHNNIFWTTGSGVPLRADDAGDSGIALLNNLYWRNGAPLVAQWNGREFRTLETFRREGREQTSQRNLGLFVDPEIPLHEAIAIRSPVTDFSFLQVFRPNAGAVVSAGIQFAEAGTGPGKHLPKDFFGFELRPEAIPVGAAARKVN